jgi:hypothetical protein
VPNDEHSVVLVYPNERAKRRKHGASGIRRLVRERGGGVRDGENEVVSGEKGSSVRRATSRGVDNDAVVVAAVLVLGREARVDVGVVNDSVA